jgi:hypothetical protein
MQNTDFNKSSFSLPLAILFARPESLEIEVFVNYDEYYNQESQILEDGVYSFGSKTVGTMSYPGFMGKKKKRDDTKDK